jgi:hypothetical protein
MYYIMQIYAGREHMEQPQPAQLQLVSSDKIDEIKALYNFLVKKSRSRKHKTFTIADVSLIYPRKPHIIRKHLSEHWRPYVQLVPDQPDTYICGTGIRRIRVEYFIDHYDPRRRKEQEQFVEHTSARPQQNGDTPIVAPLPIAPTPPPEPVVEPDVNATEHTNAPARDDPEPSKTPQEDEPIAPWYIALWLILLHTLYGRRQR